MAKNLQLSPFVYWAQTENIIFLKIDLSDVKNAKVDLTETGLDFAAKGLGAGGGIQDYKILLNFYSEIEPEDSTYSIHDSRIDFQIRKKKKFVPAENWWPRLIGQPQKPHWLKIDFDRWRSSDDSSSDLIENMAGGAGGSEMPRDIMRDYPDMYEKLFKEEFGYIRERGKKVYLIFYNLAQFIGFLYIFCVLSILYYRDGAASIPNAFANVGNILKFCQLIQYLEVMHPIFGYTKGSPLVPALQITGRNFILFAMIDNEARMQTKPVVFYLFLVWTFIEIFRYPYYISALLKKDISVLTYLRYTLWIPLYPLGILCEGIIILRNIPYFEETQRFSIDLPNKWNFAFDMTFFMKLYLLLLTLPGTYFIMTYMAKVRAKKLGGGGAGGKRKIRLD